MGDLWRSEPMQLVQLYIQRDAAHETIDELGETGIVHFHDVGYSLQFHILLPFDLISPTCL